jgi:hypothetical protein
MVYSLAIALLLMTQTASPQEGFPFEIQGKDGFKMVHRIDSTLIFTRGEKPIGDLSQPKLFASVRKTKLSRELYINRVKKDITLDFALDSLWIESFDTLKLAGLAAYEFVGAGKAGIDDSHIFVYQVLVFGEGQVFRIGAVLTDPSARRNIRTFKEMARTFKRTGAF